MTHPNDTTASEFRPIPGNPTYSINRLGHVRTPRGKSLKPWKCKNGYWYVSIYNPRRHIPIHRALLLAWVGEPEPGRDVCRHLDGNPVNNSLDNLVWGTHAENTEDKRRHGTLRGPEMKGELNPAAKITDADVPTIRTMIPVMTLEAIAEMYGVSNSAIWRIKHGKSWKHIREEAA